MPKSKTSKTKSTSKPAKNKTEAVPPSTTNQMVSTEDKTAAKPAAAKTYRSKKPHGLTNQQKAGLVKHIMSSAGNLLDYKAEQFGDENLVGIDRRLMAEQLSAWVSYLPGSFWDSRLPQPNRARGRRKL